MMSSFFRRRKYGKEVDDKIFLRNSKMLLEKLIATCNGKRNLIRDFSTEELQIATNNFYIGKMIDGSFYRFYKGFLGDRPITVMKFFVRSESVNSIAFASQMSHKNVLKLIGCCLKTEIPILVFESVEYGTLKDRLCGPHDQRHFEPLVWRDRLRIAMGIANALAYLHVGFPRPIIHGDVTPANILLDKEYVAKLSDFSLCDIIPEGETNINKDRVVGTFSFLAPEYVQTFDCNEKCDVYSFGGLLLALLTGKPNEWINIYDERKNAYQSDDHVEEVENSYQSDDYVHEGENAYQSDDYVEEGENAYLGDSVEEYFEDNKLNEIMVSIDPIIVGDETFPGKDQQLQDFAKLALKCYSREAEDRPTMVDVAKQLRQMYKSSINTP